ncbi:hypothetical protein [Streptomyces noursei]|uniref:hypothetical protein n=1 Tax=Streptomyces noursei TaxID=1971 RepID=UPI00167BCB20|nr:hypothetical protein [Streptomyces noursei]MCZ1019322.1 hypothetical protein [Streptomyces noursei]GGX07693.1 hypothetical protein GCM10010341_31360 [Streptomyces noursei]
MAAWAQTVHTLHAALPPDELARLPLRHGHPRDTAARVRTWYATTPQRALAPTVRAAIRAGMDWLDDSAPGAPATTPPFGRVEECRGPDRARLGT